ncbi:MAG: OB-fold protein [Bacteroidales bacterium]
MKIGAGLLITGLFIGTGIVLYMFNMPHRDMQQSQTDYKLTASQLVAEYLENPGLANEKYLANDGDSKIIEVTGTVVRIDENFNGQKVVLLKELDDKAGVSCTFTSETSNQLAGIQIGDKTTIKGVIRSGASYDPDLEEYENVVLQQCYLVY